jgi:hypothetical protein
VRLYLSILGLSFSLVAGCGDGRPSGPPSIAYEVENQDAVRVRNQGGETALSVDLIFRAGSRQARGCKVTSGMAEGIEVGAESELLSVSLVSFKAGQELRVHCAKGTDLRYFRGDLSNGRIVPFEEVQEVPFRSSYMLWVVFLSGIALLMLLSFFLAIMLDRLFGRLGKA